jgi:hypothetical protein
MAVTRIDTGRAHVPPDCPAIAVGETVSAMCTLSFVAKPRGYYLAMNRDERFDRGRATPPQVVDLGVLRAIFPRDVAGGTWIAVTDQGTSWALQNWHVPYAYDKTVSRGLVIPRVAACSSREEVERKLSPSELRGMLPLRLFGFLPHAREIYEWRWDGSGVHTLKFEWRPHQWFSSGLSDEKAEAARMPVFRAAERSTSAESLEWLRRLHRSHTPEGPFSICVHGEVAGTVSYTEIEVGAKKVTMRYTDGPACGAASAALRASAILLSRGGAPRVAQTAARKRAKA